MKTLMLPLLALAIHGICLANAEAQTFAIVDTGQTTFFDNSDAIAAPAVGDAFYGQDAQYSGNLSSYSPGGDGLTVNDNVTGLTWTRSADTNGDGSTTASDKLGLTAAQAYVTTINSQGYGGYSDWRIPSLKELYSLIDFNGIDPSGYEGTDTSGLTPFIDTDYFDFAYGDTNANERIIDSQYLSSTQYVGSTQGDGGRTQFGVNFADGRIKGYGTLFRGSEKTFSIALVRGNTDYGVNDFVDNTDGTVTDSATELMWSQDDSGAGMNWEEALAWVQEKNGENYLGYSDWRLPNVKELQSIVDYTRSPSTTDSAAIDPVFDTTSIVDEGGEADYPSFWSGTTHENLSGGAFGAYVAFGEADGWAEFPPGTFTLVDVHGAGAQRSDPKVGPLDANSPFYRGTTTGGVEVYSNGPQGDVVRVDHFVRLVRDVSVVPEPTTLFLALVGIVGTLTLRRRD